VPTAVHEPAALQLPVVATFDVNVHAAAYAGVTGNAASANAAASTMTNTNRDRLLRIIVPLLREMIWKLHSASQ
jgi:hypothetical protein